MRAIHLPNRRPLIIVTLLLALSLIAGCGGSTPAPTPTQPPPPTPKPPPAVTFEVKPGVEVQAGKDVAIVIKVEPFEQLAWTWDVSGTSGGRLSAKTGENVVYTAGKEGMDIVVAEAKTADGATVKKTVSLTVVAVPDTPTPVAPSGITPTPTPTMSPPSTSGVTLVEPQNDQTVKCQIIAEGTYPLDLKEQIWPIVYINGVYHPQDEGGKAAQKNSGIWKQTVRFGNCDKLENDRGKPFTLIIVTADDSANGKFEQYLKTAKANQDWRGMAELPPGTTEYARIIVIRE
jgi:hypothetical protein